jgi:fucose permease
LAFGAFIAIGLNDGGTGVLLPSLQAQYQVDKATISLLFLAGSAGYLGAAFMSGLLVEWLGLRRFLLLGALACLLGTGLLSTAPPFVAVLLALIGLGFGVAILDAGLNAYIAGLPGAAPLLNYLHAFYGAGALLGPLVASAILAAAWGWSRVYLVWAAVSLSLLAGIAVIFQRPAAPPAAEGPNVLLAALRQRAVGLAALFLMLYVGSEVSLGSWSYSFLTEERHLADLPAGWAVSGFWLGLTLGRLILGRLADRLGQARLIQGCLAGLAAGVLLVWLAPAGALAALGLVLAGFSLGPIYPTSIALLATLVPARLLPSAVGFVASAGSVGAAFFPWLAGNLAARFGLWILLPYVLALSVALLGTWRALRGQQPAAGQPDAGAAAGPLKPAGPAAGTD